MSTMEFVGFSFHFKAMADCRKAKAAVARIQQDCHYSKSSQVRGGIDVASLRLGDDFFYVRWQKPINAFPHKTGLGGSYQRCL